MRLREPGEMKGRIVWRNSPREDKVVSKEGQREQKWHHKDCLAE